MPIRAVLDTNVLVSGLVAEGGAPRRIVDAWLEGRFTLVLSPYLLEELLHVLTYPRIANRIRLEEEEDLEVLLGALVSQAEVTEGMLSLPGVTRDPKDDPVVACAREGEADYIVSGDQDLLVLGEYEGIRVVSPREFVEILETRAGL
ncbi:MAG: putative toxin-antitoxin system toxin component, PIN family [Anaerolineae bacterium]|nr:putative toxin-antitoxin system toxin component, PIN family [Anaerolineae bacterium]MCX8068080.1 putative toxin-antitoxin system toxin component, PIN family [Anaerolineae bacterium]